MRLGDCALQQNVEVCTEAFDRRRVEQVRVVLEPPQNLLPAWLELE
jgi:hypothetical protein